MIKIGITYDTIEDYPGVDYSKYCDFASLPSISFLKNQFEQAGFETVLIGSVKQLKAQLEAGTLHTDFIYNTAEGMSSRNREGMIPALLELYGFSYIGSDSYALSLSLNKHHTKILAEYCNIPTPQFEVIYQYDSSCEIHQKVERLNFPIVVKPNCEGSSMGVSIARTMQEAMEAIVQNASDYQQETLCEEYIGGMEITVPIIGTGAKTEALGVIRFCRKDGSDISLFDSDDKHFADIRCEDAHFTAAVKDAVMKYAVDIHNILGCRDINRVDFRIDEQNNIYFLEMNPLPALDPGGSFECAAGLHNMNFSQLLRRIVREAQARM